MHLKPWTLGLKREHQTMTAIQAILCLSLITTAQSLSPTARGQASVQPHLIGCVSREMMTFRCRWDPGSYTEPDDLKLFYMIDMDMKKTEKVWSECPSYSPYSNNECYFDESHTNIWCHYGIQLRSQSQDIIYDELHFSVENIVYPEPPVALNWTLLRVGQTRIHSDIVVSWEPPPSAAENVKIGWMQLVYETEYRERGTDKWSTTNSGKDTKEYIYGLHTNTVYEVRVRCKMQGYNFGNFSDPILIHIPTEESSVPIAFVLSIAAVGVGIIILLIFVSRQQKLLVILLPPVPSPNIKGIDPELLQKGKLTELTSILSTHKDLRPELYGSDPWVEFIEVDIDEPNERMEDLDTQLLLGDSPASDSPISGGLRDDDSGRASCCDPDLQDPYQRELPQPMSSPSAYELSPSARTESPLQGRDLPPQQTQWASRDLYSQVSRVTSSGQVVLSPEEESKAQKEQSGLEKVLLKEQALGDRNKGERAGLQLMVTPDVGDYTSELDMTKIRLATEEPSKVYSASTAMEKSLEHGIQPVKEECQISPSAEAMSLMQSEFSFTAQSPNAEYTMVDGVDCQNSLLLKPNTTQATPLNLIKPPQAPEGYLTPDLLENIAP